MHNLSKIRVQNFKSIPDHEFPLSAYTPLVGYNNAGKTNILKALEWVLKKRSLQAADFFDASEPVVVTAQIEGVSAEVLDALEEKHRKKIEPLVTNSRISIRRTQLTPGDSVTKFRLEVFSEEEGEWRINPTGIDTAISILFPEPIFIGAMENATEDVGKFTTSTTIGKLLKEIIDPISERHGVGISEALDEISRKLSADGDQKDEDLIKLDERIENELSRFFPGVSAKTHIPTPIFADFLKGATIKIFEKDYEDAEGRDAGSFGHGAQRSIQIALLKCLSEIRKENKNAHGRTTLLLIDEPELYLHPQAIEVIRASLKRLSGDGYQVAFSTHSANMILRVDASNVLLVRRNSDIGTFALPRIKDAVTEAIDDADHQSETLFSLTNSSKILFSEKVLLAEGKTEKALLPEIFFHSTGATLDEEKLGLVSIDGVNNIPNAMKVLQAMKLPTKSIVDLDFAFRGAINAGFIEGGDVNIANCKAILKRLEADGKVKLDGNGLPMKHNGEPAYKAFELLALEADATEEIEKLHEKLKMNSIWLWKKGAVEVHVGLEAKSPVVQMNFIKSLESKTLSEIAPDEEGINSLIDWLRE